MVSVLVLLVLAAAMLAPRAASANGDDCGAPVLGEQEPVEIGTRLGPETAVVVAKVDTGAGYSSIDESLARSLGIDLEDAETIDIRSSLGEEERPVVDVRLRVAGKTIDTRMTVSDRQQLTHPALLGNRDLQGFLVDVSREEITTPTGSTPAQYPPGLFGAASTRSGALTLLASIPVTAALVVAVRTLVGLATFGVFAPILLTLAFAHTGLVRGLGLFVAVLAAGLLVQPLLRRLHLPRVARLATLVAVVVELVLIVDLYLAELVPVGAGAVAFPVVVLAIIIERFWTNWEEESLLTALKTGGWTLAVAVAAYPILVADPMRSWADRAPLAIGLLGGILALLFGSYRGLRLLELVRFRRVTTERGVA